MSGAALFTRGRPSHIRSCTGRRDGRYSFGLLLFRKLSLTVFIHTSRSEVLEARA